MLAGLRHRFRLNAKATSELGSLAMRGHAKAVGTARPAKRRLGPPITGRRCVFYAVDIGEWINGTKTPLLDEHSTELFQIEDATGSALIDPGRVQLQLQGNRAQGHSSECLAEHRELLKRHGLTMLDEYGELRSLAYRETIIAPGDPICALGSISRRADPGGAASYRQQPQQTGIGSDAETALLPSMG